MDDKFGTGHYNKESTGLGGLSQAQSSVELTTKERYKSKIILSHCRICSTLRQQYMDINKEARTTARWHILANAVKSTQCLMETAYDDKICKMSARRFQRED